MTDQSQQVIEYVPRLRGAGKLCSHCLIVHPLSEFRENNISANKISGECKRCQCYNKKTGKLIDRGRYDDYERFLSNKAKAPVVRIKGYVSLQAERIRRRYGLEVAEAVLEQWLLKNPNFLVLHKAWKDNNYWLQLRPVLIASFDIEERRVKLQSIEEFSLVTHRERTRLRTRDKKGCKRV